MGNVDSKLNFRKAILQLTHSNQQLQSDEQFWEEFWCHQTSLEEVFALITPNEIRKIRTEHPANLATLCYKAVEKLAQMVDNSCRTQSDHQSVLNCVRLLIHIIPYIFEDDVWRDFFWSSLPANDPESRSEMKQNFNATTTSTKLNHGIPLAQSLLNAVCDLLFCPDFTVVATQRSGPDKAEELANIDSCEFIWDAGVGFAHSPPHNSNMERRRTELLKLLLTCFSEAIYRPPQCCTDANKWIAYFTSSENRHALPLFTSFLNTICAYDPIVNWVPYNYLLFTDTAEPLVEVCLQVLIVSLDHDVVTRYDPKKAGGQHHQSKHHSQQQQQADNKHVSPAFYDESFNDNLFINYLSRVHRDEDFNFILKGITRLLNNPLTQNYLPNSTKRLHCHQELLILFWKICDYNKKFLYFVLKSSHVLDILIPILYHLNYSRADQSRVGLMHIGIFILLLLSGERNFGVRLNKPYTATVPMDIPVFTGSHADLLITVFHKIIATGHQRLQPLFDCLLTVLVNVSPYLKTLSMVASVKLLHLLEAFSTPWFLLSAPNNHHLVFFLLEIFNNIIQYQFDGNSNLVYTIIRKRHVFHAMANLPSDMTGITKCLTARKVSKFNLPRVANNVAVTSQHLPSHVPEEEEDNNDDDDDDDDESKRHNITTGGHQNHHHSGDEGNAAGGSTGGGGGGSATAKQIDESGDAMPALKISLLDTPDINEMTATEHASVVNNGDAVNAEGGYMSDVTTTIGAVQSLYLGADGCPKPLHSPKPNTSAREESGSSGSGGNSVTTLSIGQNNCISMIPNTAGTSGCWTPTPEWIVSWRTKLPLQTIMRLLQVLVPQVEKICIDKGLTDESEILKFLQHGTLVGLLPVPHPILIRKYQANSETTAWFRTYIWGVIYLRNVEPPIWYDTDVKLFEIQRV